MDPLSFKRRGDDQLNIERPYSFADFSNAAIRNTIKRIYDSARRETREIYELGRDSEQALGENWIIQWMLWHIFRYRDGRNRNRKVLRHKEMSERGSFLSRVCSTRPTICAL